MVVDSKQEFCPKKVVRANGREKLIRSDHLPILVVLKNMPKKKKKVEKKSQWNLHKPGGWEVYKAAMEEASEKINNVIEDDTISVEEVMNKTDVIMNKVKFKAFGKTKPMTQKSCRSRLEIRLKAAQGLDTKEKVKELRKKQYNDMEEEINNLKKAKFGRATNVHKMKEKVTGSKKAAQEPHAILDVETDELVVNNETIKKVTLKHCLNALNDKVPGDEVKPLVDLVNKAHDARMTDIGKEEVDVYIEEFEEVLEKIQRKHKKSYDFLTKAGAGFKTSVFKLCRRIIRKEEAQIL